MKTITLTTKDADFILKYLRDNLEQLEKAFQEAKKNFEKLLKEQEEIKTSPMYKGVLEKTGEMKSENNPFGMFFEMLASTLSENSMQSLSKDFEEAERKYHTRHEELEQMILLLTIGSENESRD